MGQSQLETDPSDSKLALEEAEQCATQNSSLLTQKELPGRPMVANIRVLLWGGGGPEKQRGGWVALPAGSHTSWV